MPVTDENLSPARLLLEQLENARAGAERRAAEAELKLAAVLESSDGAVVGVDLDGSISSWSSGAARMLGYRSEHIAGRPAATLFATDGEVTLWRVLERVRRHQTVERTEHELRRADGKPIAAQVAFSAIHDGHGTAIAALLIAHDVTARKHAEDALAAANQALRAARAELEARVEARTADLSHARRELETLLYVAAHDLKEPLNALLISSNMLSDRYRDALDEKGCGIIDRITRAATRMSRLLADLLLLTRANTFDAHFEPLDGDALVSEALERFADTIRTNGARVSIEQGLPKLYVHRTWAVEAIASLVSNALKFTRDDEPAEVEIVPYDGAAGPGICVRDRGPGVPLELEERIFKLFQRGVGRDVEGTGAGLAIVREIARRHGGDVFVRRRAGGGSEFVVTFGRKPSHAAPRDVAGDVIGPRSQAAH